MSGGEPSSIKREPACAASPPALSRFLTYRVYHTVKGRFAAPLWAVTETR